MRILVLNPGSSTLKASVLDVDVAERLAREPPDPLDSTTLDWGVDASSTGDPAAGVRSLFERVEGRGIRADSIEAIGYRVVHGGDRFRAPVRVDKDVAATVDELRDLAPLHNGVAAATMRAGLAAAPSVPQVAVFDTAFHASLEPAAFRYPLPPPWFESWGIRRYGFHGLSVDWSTRRAAVLLERPATELRLVVAHLGSGCSVTAVDGGRSVDTSMGLTPLEGLMMGTRAGSIDPGVLLWGLTTGHRSLDELAEELDHEAGLVGVSGRTSDVRELLALEADGDERATLALELFVRRAAAGIAASATALPALDALVFTAGIGEHAAAIRRRIVGRLAPLGFAPLGAADPAGDGLLSDAASLPAVLRIAAREDLVIADAVRELVGET